MSQPSALFKELHLLIASLPPRRRSQLALLLGLMLLGALAEVISLGAIVPFLAFLTDPEQALQRSQEGLSQAQELAHPPSLGLALMSAAFLHQLRREEDVVQEQAEAMITFCSDRPVLSVIHDGCCSAGKDVPSS